MVTRREDLPSSSPEGDNQVLPDIWSQPIWWQLLERRLAPRRPVLLLGRQHEVTPLTAALRGLGRDVRGREWLWTSPLDLGVLPANTQVVVRLVPASATDWLAMGALRERYGSDISTLYELLLPYTALTQAQSVLPYQQATIDSITPFYFGDSQPGPFEELDKLVALSGKSVIEFGPMEGLQTAALVRAGVESGNCSRPSARLTG